MSTVVPPKGHRHTRSAAMPPATASSQNPKNPHHLNSQSHVLNSRSETNSTEPTTPPRTPRKNEHVQPASQTKVNSTPHENASKQKPRNKRPKNVMTSPAAARNGRSTPPLTGAQSAGMPSSAKPISTPSTAAYAGPTFHASPAPSALPIPSFYSKSVPESPGMKGLKSLKEPSSSESPTPVPSAVLNPQLQREESPLDFFFKADREEKARARSASSTQTAAPNTGPFKPPVTSPRMSQTPPAPTSQNRPRNPNRISSSGMFAMELDGEGTAGTPYGPAFSTPYSERINAARSGSHHQSPQEAQPSMTSEALKAYLFSGHQSPSPAASSASRGVEREHLLQAPPASATHVNGSTAMNGLRNTGPSSRPQNSYGLNQESKTPTYPFKASGRSSGLRQEVTPTRTPTKTPDRSANITNSPTPSRMYGNYTPSNTNDFLGMTTPQTTSPPPASSYGVSSGNRNADIKGMEDSLRKILKLDSDSGISGVPATAASGPNCVGGRPPPLNGMHSGVMGS